MNLQAGRGFQMELTVILRTLMKGDNFLLTLVNASRLFSMLFVTALYSCQDWKLMCKESVFNKRNI